ncbi:hypothetical protein [Gordoniibacillus kamchatkensis]|uniref:hypothetical protein n=1 Tax=Gordoniibacillus kamchatkensis TaxID=1590651 RepID=UPI000696D452|nr:hypothetical protein [Paenibacillus sp. VKM B-2647]
MFRRTAAPMLIVVLLLGFCLSVTPAAYAEMGDGKAAGADAEALVQKGLTIAEIDRELERLRQEDAALTAQIADSEKQVAAQTKLVQSKRQHAGRVLRAYYMGERDSLWLLLFSLHSFQDAVKTFEYLSMIIAGDQRKLADYMAAMTEMKKLQAGLVNAQAKLKQAEAEYLAQRDRLIRLQDELDKQLAATPEAQEVMKRIETVTTTWQQRGMPLFRNYFDALSEAMKALPELAAKGPDGKPRLTLDGLNATFAISMGT